MNKLATLLCGAAVALGAAPAAAYTVVPAEGWPGQSFGSFTVNFDQAVAVSDASGISVDYNIGAGTDKYDVTGGMTLAADGNSLTVTFDRGDIYVGKQKPFASQSFKPGSTTVKEGDMIFHINAGAYTVGGAEGEALTISYYIADENPFGGPVTYNATFTPAPGEVTELGDITVSFGEGNTVTVDEYPDYALLLDGQMTYAYFEVSAQGDAVTFKAPATLTAPGTYELIIGEGTISVNGTAQGELRASWLIAQAAAQEFPFTSAPSQTQWLTSLKDIYLTFDGEVTIDPNFVKAAQYDFEGCLYTNNNFASEDTFGGQYLGNGLHTDGNTLFFGIAKTGGITEGWEPYSGYGKFKGGILTVYVREGSYFVNGVPGKEIALHFYISDRAPLFFTEFDAVPEDGDEIDVLDEITLEFIEEDVDITLVPGMQGRVLRDGEELDAVVAVKLIDSITLGLTVIPAQTQAGSYTVELPTGVFRIQGIDNTPVKVDYTVTGNAQSDITVTPAEGEVNLNGGAFGPVTVAFQGQVAWVAPVLTVNGLPQAAAVKLLSDGNNLTVDFEGLSNEAGEYVLTVPAGSYLLNGEAGEALTFQWTVTTTGVLAAAAAPEGFTVYDMQGRLIVSKGNAADIQNLKGMYIVNGKAYIIR